MLWGIIGWIVIGLIAGWLASMIMGRGGYGVIGDIIVGLVGALIGGFLAGALFGYDTGQSGFWVSLLVAVVGAVILIWLVRMFTRGRTNL